MAIGQASVIQKLEQAVEDIGMRLLYLVKKDDTVRTPPYCLGKLAAFLVANIARRGADEPGNRVPLLVLGHIKADHGVLIVKEEPGKGTDELGLADSGRSQEDKTADGTSRVFQSGTAAANGFGDGGDRLLLVNQSFVDSVFHVEQFLRLALQHLGNGDAGPAGD